MEVRIEGLEDLLRQIIREELSARRESWLTTREAAEHLGTTTGHIHNLVSEGRLPRHGDKGHGLRFTRADLDAYIEGRRGT